MAWSRRAVHLDEARSFAGLPANPADDRDLSPAGRDHHVGPGRFEPGRTCEVDGVESSFEEAYQIRFEKYNAFQQWFVSAGEVTVWAVPLMVLFVGNSSWHSRFGVLLCVAFLTFYWVMTHWDPAERFMDDPVISNIEKDTRFVVVPIVLSVAVLFAVVISLLPIRKMWHSQRKSSAHLQYVFTANLAHY